MVDGRWSMVDGLLALQQFHVVQCDADDFPVVGVVDEVVVLGLRIFFALHGVVPDRVVLFLVRRETDLLRSSCIQLNSSNLFFEYTSNPEESGKSHSMTVLASYFFTLQGIAE